MKVRHRETGSVVDAFRWTAGADQEEKPEWAIEAIRSNQVIFENVGTPQVTLRIETAFGTLHAHQGDWIVRDTEGHVYPCKAELFSLNYEQVPDKSEDEAA
jgi:hypothetical protein